MADIEKGIGRPEGEKTGGVLVASPGKVAETPSLAAAPLAPADDEGTADWYSLYCIYLAVVADGIAIGIIVPYRYGSKGSVWSKGK